MGNLEANIKVSMTRDYGITTVTFEAQTVSPVPIEGALITNDLLTALVLKEFTHFEENTLKQVRGAKAQHSYTEEQIPADAITVSRKNGKRLYNVIGGQWSRHGVPFYEEHMKEGGINPNEIPDEGQKLTNMRAIIQVEDGKPKRVIKLVAN